jgi:DNA polymerase-4
VRTGRRRGSIGSQRALGFGCTSRAELEASLLGLVDRVTRRLRGAHRVARTVTVRLRFDDLSVATRSHTLDHPTAHTPTVLSVARQLLDATMPLICERGATLIGVAVSQLTDDDSVQLVLPFTRADDGALDEAVDRVRARFGTDAVGRAALLGHRAGTTVPLLPD